MSDEIDDTDFNAYVVWLHQRSSKWTKYLWMNDGADDIGFTAYAVWLYQRLMPLCSSQGIYFFYHSLGILLHLDVYHLNFHIPSLAEYWQWRFLHIDVI